MKAYFNVFNPGYAKYPVFLPKSAIGDQIPRISLEKKLKRFNKPAAHGAISVYICKANHVSLRYCPFDLVKLVSLIRHATPIREIDLNPVSISGISENCS